MGKCLVTKLNGSISNNKLLRLGEMRVHFAKSESPTASTQGKTFAFVKDAELEIIGDAYFTDKTLSENKGKKITVPANSEAGFFVSNNDCDIAILDKYSLSKIHSWAANIASYSANVSFTIDDLKYSNTLTSINMDNANVTGDIASLKNLTALEKVAMKAKNITGDIANLKNLTSLKMISLRNSAAITGDIANLKNLTSLTTLDLISTSVTGDIANLKNLTSLTTIYLASNSVTGDIANLKNLTSLTTLDLINTSVTGDIAELETCPNIGYLRLPDTTEGDLAKLPKNCHFVAFSGNSNTTYTWSERPSSSKIFSIQGGNINVSNIDKMLQDLAQCQAAIPSSGETWFKTISVAGNRTSASDAAVATLQQKGYTISINKA